MTQSDDALSQDADSSAINFVGFVLSLAHPAAVHVGDDGDPVSGETVEAIRVRIPKPSGQRAAVSMPPAPPPITDDDIPF